MIITRSPLRITLGGGGTDLRSYYQDHEGYLIAAAIDKYVYITLHKTFVEEFILKYSQMERVLDVNDIQHPIVRESMKLLNIPSARLEMASMADIPSGTGLGSSGSFTTALLKALHTYRKNIIQPHQLAEQACHIEIERLGSPIGKQDQFIASYGGVTCFHFAKDGTVTATPLEISEQTLYNLEDNLLLFFTGYSRSANTILKEQDDKSKESNKDMIENLHFIKDLCFSSKKALESGHLMEFAKLMDVHWQRKKERSKNMSNEKINEWYDYALKNGAAGGKLIGAGGGGFLMFYSEEKSRLRQAMSKIGLEEVRFRFDFEGTKVAAS